MLLSVNVGMPQDVTWRGRTVHTGVWKKPADGDVLICCSQPGGDVVLDL